MTIREKILELEKQKRRFAVMANFYTFLDMLAYDTKDPDNFRMICKFNTNAHTILEPTFGTPQHGTGLQEIIIPYNQVTAVVVMDVSEDLLNKFKKEMPEAYDWWSKVNYVEGVDFEGGVMPEIAKSKAVQEYEKTHKEFKPIKTSNEDGVEL